MSINMKATSVIAWLNTLQLYHKTNDKHQLKAYIMFRFNYPCDLDIIL